MAQQFAFHTPIITGEKADGLDDTVRGLDKTDRKRGSKTRRMADYAKAESRREDDEKFM